MSEKLKPCPFCGYPPHMDKHEIFCDCGVKLEFPLQEWGCSDKNPEGFPTYEQAKEVAVERWNNREETAEKLPTERPLTFAELKELPVPCVAILEDKIDMSIRPVTIWRVDDLAIMLRGDNGLWHDEYGITKRLWRCGTFRNPTDEERSAAKWEAT